MTWTVVYMRYQVEGRHECDSRSEAISYAMWGIEDGYLAPSAIIGPSGAIVLDKPALSDFYARLWGTGKPEEAEFLDRSAVATAVPDDAPSV